MKYTKKFTVSYDDPDFETKVVKMFKRYGVCLILGVMKKKRAQKLMAGIVEKFEGLYPDEERQTIDGEELKMLDHENIDTWTFKNLPPNTRPGLYQAVVGHLPEVWEARTDKRIRKIFTTLYSGIKNVDVDKVVPSIDGINIYPNEVLKKRGSATIPDWPHIDQTSRDDKFKCIQGQLVLTRTTACFRCSPKSHKVHEKILDIAGIEKTDTSDRSAGPRAPPSDWCRFNTEDSDLMEKVKAEVESVGGKWQIPILPPGKKLTSIGSFIVWSSSLIHSARNNTRLEKFPETGQSQFLALDPYRGWRGVIYISCRPHSEYSVAQLEKVKKYIRENRSMNHWNKKVFAKSPGGRFQPARNATITNIIQNPTLVYEKFGIDPEDFVRMFEEYYS